jgi:hypothetical protein
MYRWLKSVLMVQKIRVPEENNQHCQSRCQIPSHEIDGNKIISPVFCFLVYYRACSLNTFFLFVEYQFSWFSLVQTNHEFKCTSKGINNVRRCFQVLNQRIQMSTDISVSANPQNLTPPKTKDTPAWEIQL